MDNSFAIGFITGLALVFVLLAWTYNRLVRMRNRVQNAWSDVDVQLKRRHDLVPNLVETVRGYATHERQTLEAVTAPAPRPLLPGQTSERAPWPSWR